MNEWNSECSRELTAILHLHPTQVGRMGKYVAIPN